MRLDCHCTRVYSDLFSDHYLPTPFYHIREPCLKVFFMVVEALEAFVVLCVTKVVYLGGLALP